MQTKPNRPAIFLLITLIGAPLGYFARGAMERSQDRAAEMVNLFATHCLPMAKDQQPPDPKDLVPLESIPHVFEWADPSSKLLLNRSSQQCSVSDELMQLNAVERLAVETALPELIQNELPGFKLAPPEKLLESWDLVLDWVDSNRHDARRAAIMLLRFANTGDAAATAIYLRMPAN